jgi:transcriptional regulator with XRE-family HTH domain
MPDTEYPRAILARFRRLREKAGISQSDLETALILGPGWLDRFETAETLPSLDMLAAMAHAIGEDLASLASGIPVGAKPPPVDRSIDAFQEGPNLEIRFRYASYDATYTLRDATTQQFDQVIRELRDGLARLTYASDSESEAIKTDSVARAFLLATKIWPQANPSDLWWFLIYRAYCDPYNQPALFARLDLAQSWKRTGGWALEQVLVRHYGPYLRTQGVELAIETGPVKQRYLNTAKIDGRLESDKVDVLLLGGRGGKKRFFGVVHVKASFAERRTDDVPLSQALVRAGYVSPLWTMDCKSMPAEHPENRGELGANRQDQVDERSAKRKDIEDDGYFSACFSYNLNTRPTPLQQAAKARVYVCTFSNPDDGFSQFVRASWRDFRIPE